MSSEGKSERKLRPHAVPSSWHGSGTAGFKQDPNRASTTRGWNWILGHDGKPLTADGTPTQVKGERNHDESLSNGNAAISSPEEHRMKSEVIPSAAIGIASNEPIPSSSSAAASKYSFQTEKDSATTESVPYAAGIISPKPEPKPPPSCDAPDCGGKRKRESSPRRGWAWLLAPDGSFSTVEPKTRFRKKQRQETSCHIPRKSRPSRKASAGLNYTESHDDVEEEEWSVSTESDHDNDNVDGESRFDINKDEGYSSSQSKKWEAKYRLLVEYKNKHGSTRVLQSDDRTLCHWVFHQRQKYKGGKLSRYRQQCLNSLGFEWSCLSDQWEAKYRLLIEYKNKHGTTRAESDRTLNRWVKNQRERYKAGKLSRYRQQINLLESIGFEWQVGDQIPWATMYNRLVAYKKKYNTTRVSAKFKEDPRLANWVSVQRRKCKAKDRIDLLNSIGFEWKPYEADWMNNYKRLVAYKKKHGNTRIPQGWKTDPQLANWAHWQRNHCKDQERIDLLNAIAFE